MTVVMILHVSLGPETLPTLRARKRFFVGVYAHVNFQIRFFTKGLGAESEGASKWLGTIMMVQMSPKSVAT